MAGKSLGRELSDAFLSGWYGRKGTPGWGGVFATIALAIVLPPVALTLWVIAKVRDPAGAVARREQAETQALYEEVLALSAQFDRGDAAHAGEVLATAIVDQAPGDPPSADILAGIRAAIEDLYRDEGFEEPGELNLSQPLETSEAVAIRNELRRLKRLYRDGDKHLCLFIDAITASFGAFVKSLPPAACPPVEDDDSEPEPLFELSALLPELLKESGETVAGMVYPFFGADIVKAGIFEGLQEQLDRNGCDVSGFPYEVMNTTTRKFVTPDEADLPPAELVHSYLKGTPLEYPFGARVPFPIPIEARFEHMHVVGGTGHGKTQLLQSLIDKDLTAALEDGRSVVVIDSQGDLIDTILHHPYFDPNAEKSLADRLLLVDPKDADHPIALNMFDIDAERLRGYDTAGRQTILRGTIALYEYLFGALLGAELTQKQGLIFRFLARLMLEIPGANVHTLRRVMEDGEPFKPYMQRLSGSAREFFEHQFFERGYGETKQQVARRLWGVLENETLEAMFAAPHNKVDMFAAINAGKIILVNTAKDLLGSEGSAILGRFFLAMIGQAVLHRSAVGRGARTPAFVYIDEAAEYVDDKIVELINQARKYKVGLIFAHQNLDQLSFEHRASFMASTRIKLAGGVSVKDAGVLADEMRCEPHLILDARKEEKRGSEFACYIGNVTPNTAKVWVPFGVIERRGRLEQSDVDDLRAQNRKKYSTDVASDAKEPDQFTEEPPGSDDVPVAAPAPAETGDRFRLGEHELL